MYFNSNKKRKKRIVSHIFHNKCTDVHSFTGIDFYKDSLDNQKKKLDCSAVQIDWVGYLKNCKMCCLVLETRKSSCFTVAAYLLGFIWLI